MKINEIAKQIMEHKKKASKKEAPMQSEAKTDEVICPKCGTHISEDESKEQVEQE